MTDTPTSATAIEPELLESIKSQFAFQKKWQRLSMVAYVSSTIGILFCSTLATLTAAKQWSDAAAYLAAATTILVSLEKSMLFREKWKFHLGFANRLSALLASIEAGMIDTAKVVTEYGSILKAYADTLPIAAREDSESRS